MLVRLLAALPGATGRARLARSCYKGRARPDGRSDRPAGGGRGSRATCARVGLAGLLLALTTPPDVRADHAPGYPHPTPFEVAEAMRACLDAEPMYVLRVSPAARPPIDLIVITARGHFYLGYTGIGANWVYFEANGPLVYRMHAGFVEQAEACYRQVDQTRWRA
jgi:hypothetical protein